MGRFSVGSQRPTFLWGHALFVARWVVVWWNDVAFTVVVCVLAKPSLVGELVVRECHLRWSNSHLLLVVSAAVASAVVAVCIRADPLQLLCHAHTKRTCSEARFFLRCFRSHTTL